MRFVLFYQSFVSCWNHGNAHFLRGVARELIRLGHDVTVYEPADGWSRCNALQDGGAAYLAEAQSLVPGVKLESYRLASLDLDRALTDADVVIAHEWNDPELIAALGEQRAASRRFMLLFHDTHHRAISAADEISRFALDRYDAVLAFGEVLRELYLDLGWGHRAFTWHEAADVPLFRPHPDTVPDTDLIWIGNWGDGERDSELQQYLIDPVRQSSIKARVHGVRYPEDARARLRESGVEYAGWLPNHLAPQAFARARLTVHVPRRPYVERLIGIPTIRVFEALACAIPLVSAPWHDSEGLFPPGCFLTGRSSEEAAAAFRLLKDDRELAGEMALTGLQAIRSRHTCAHRVRELLAIIESIRRARPSASAPMLAATEEVAEP